MLTSTATQVLFVLASLQILVCVVGTNTQITIPLDITALENENENKVLASEVKEARPFNGTVGYISSSIRDYWLFWNNIEKKPENETVEYKKNNTGDNDNLNSYVLNTVIPNSDVGQKAAAEVSVTKTAQEKKYPPPFSGSVTYQSNNIRDEWNDSSNKNKILDPDSSLLPSSSSNIRCSFAKKEGLGGEGRKVDTDCNDGGTRYRHSLRRRLKHAIKKETNRT